MLLLTPKLQTSKTQTLLNQDGGQRQEAGNRRSQGKTRLVCLVAGLRVEGSKYLVVVERNRNSIRMQQW